MRKDRRTLKICEQSGYRYKPTPAILLKGAWLEEWGFSANMLVDVVCEEGKLVIIPREEITYIDAFEGQKYACKVAEKGGV